MEKLTQRLIAALIFLGTACNVYAFDNPYAELPVERVKSTVIHSFPRFTFLEDVAIDKGGAIYASNHLEGKIYKIEGNNVSTLLDIEGELLCMTRMDDNSLIVTGRDLNHQQYLYQVAADGAPKRIAHLPDAEFLNGVATLDSSHVLVADSYKGVIWKVNVKTGKHTIWIDGPLFERPSRETVYPGINGIQINNNYVYASNSTKALLVRVPINKDLSASTAEIIKQGILVDDFVLDRKGNLYGATHIFNSIIKLTVNNEMSIIAQIDQGVAGSTALSWIDDAQTQLLVSGNGAMNSVNKSDVLPARITQLSVNELEE